MVEQVTAYKCEATGCLYSKRTDAIKSEFKSRMKQVGGTLPAYGSVNSIGMFDWISSQITDGIYPAFYPKLLEALLWWDENKSAASQQSD